MSNLKAIKRERTSSGSNNKLRAEGLVPAILYGGTNPNQNISVQKKDLKNIINSDTFLSKVLELDIDGKKERVIPRDVSFHVVSEEPVHIDFMRIVSGKKIILEIPVKFINHPDSPGLKRGGVLNIVRRKVEFKLSKQKPKFKGLLTTGNIDEKKIYAIKPLTFMNNSGTAIKELIDYFKIDAKDVFVFHDDLDIDFGKIKAKFGGSSAGHNGIESIDKFIGKDYSRVRIGIGHPKQKKKVNNHVLEDFKEDEEEKINEISENIVKQLPTLIGKKIDLFSSKVNQDLNGI